MQHQSYHQQGSVYLVVLASAMLLMVVGVSAVIGSRLQRRAYAGYQNASNASPIAMSGIDLVMHEIGTNPYWRRDFKNGLWWENRDLGAGLATITVTDPSDSSLAVNPNQPVRILSQAQVGTAQSTYQVDLNPAPVDEHATTYAMMQLRPLAYWPMKEPSGSVAYDLSYRYFGSYTGGVTLKTGPGPNADQTPYFDGNDDVVVVGHHDDMLLDNGSIAVWFQIHGNSNRHYGIFTKDADSVGEGGHMALYVTDSKKIRAKLQSTSTTYDIDHPDEVRHFIWYHAVMTWGSEGFHLYVNGQLVGTNAYTGGLGTSSGGLGNHEPIAIGATTRDTLDRSLVGIKEYFQGYIYQAGIFDRQLNTDEVKTLFDAGGLYRPLRIIPGSYQEVVDTSVVITAPEDVEGLEAPK